MSRDADAIEDEVEISKAMLRAGLDAYWAAEGDKFTPDSDAVCDIYRAMVRANEDAQAPIEESPASR